MIKTYSILFFLFVFSIGLQSQSVEEFSALKTNEEKYTYLKDTASVLVKSEPEKAKKYYDLGLELAQQSKEKSIEADFNRRIGYLYFAHRDFGQCSLFTQKAIEIAGEVNDYKTVASSYKRIAYMNYMTRDYDGAQEAFSLSADHYLLNADTSDYITMEFMSGVSFFMLGKYPNALDSYQKSLALAEKSENIKGQSNALNNIGNIQDILGNYPLALNYLQQALDIRIECGNEKGANSTKENMATVYSKMGDYERALELYLEIYDFKKESEDEEGISTTVMNIGYANEKLGKFNNALEFYSQSLKLLYKLDDNQNIAVCLNNIGDIYYAHGKYQQAIDSSKKSLDIAKKLNSKTGVKSSALSLTKSYVEKQNYREAYFNHVLYAQVKDSLFNEESAKILQEMETKYQSEKKQQEIEKQLLTIEKQDAQARTQRIMLFAMFGGLLLVVLIAVQVFRGYKQKKKANALLSAKNIEIEEKNEHLNQANVEITEQKAEIEEKNLNIMDSIRYAKRIQQTILPRDQFVEKLMPESFILYKPKDIVSGDFYWVENVDDKVYVSAVDCTGHGVPGAFVSIVGYNSLNRTVMEFKLEQPGEILNKLNDLVVDTFVRHSDSDVKDGMDMSLISLDLKNKEIEFAGAQNPLYIVNDDGVEEIKANKQPIGSSLEPKHFDNHMVNTKNGDMVYLFSDGYIDQFGGPKGKKFMRKRFKELLSSIHKMDVKTQKLHLDNTIIDWMGEEEQLDDILVIGIRV